MPDEPVRLPAAPPTSLLPLTLDDGRVLSVESITNEADRPPHPPRRDFPDRLRLRMDYPDGACATTQDYVRYMALAWSPAQPGRYRKKPVVVDAFQLTRETRYDNRDWPEWLQRAWHGRRNEPGTLQTIGPATMALRPAACDLEIVTLEGNHRVSWDDWIIRGVQGELYPCKPSVFAATYEPATGEARP